MQDTEMNIIPISQTKLSQKGNFLLPRLLQKSSKPEVKTQNLWETDSEYIPPLNADLDFIVQIFCLLDLVLGAGVGFFWKGYGRQYICMYEANTILLSTDKIQKQNMHNHKCQEKILVVLWLCEITWESLCRSASWVLLEDFESCQRKG